MKQDIQNKEDIILLVNTFYDHVKIDKVIGHFFIEVVDVHWETHLPKMYEFWSQILFQNGNFNGNPMQTHRHVHSLHNMTKEDFEHWLFLFKNTVDSLFEGNNAEIIKQRAANIATSLTLKVVYNMGA